jgi:hypothetical protein
MQGGILGSGKNGDIIIHQGVLKKRNYFNKHYTPHFFALKGNGRLYYYKVSYVTVYIAI